MLNALKRKEKEETVDKLTKAFEESTAVFGIRFQHISVSSQCSLLLKVKVDPRNIILELRLSQLQASSLVAQVQPSPKNASLQS